MARSLRRRVGSYRSHAIEAKSRRCIRLYEGGNHEITDLRGRLDVDLILRGRTAPRSDRRLNHSGCCLRP